MMENGKVVGKVVMEGKPQEAISSLEQGMMILFMATGGHVGHKDFSISEGCSSATLVISEELAEEDEALTETMDSVREYLKDVQDSMNEEDDHQITITLAEVN